MGDDLTTVAYLFGASAAEFKVDGTLSEGMVLDMGEWKLEVLETPGHSQGCICLYERTEKVLFSGDTVFPDGNIGRTDMYGGDTKELINSIQRLTGLDVKTMYPGHMEITSNDVNRQIQMSLRFASRTVDENGSSLMIDKDELIKRESQSIFQTYTRQELVLVRGSGAQVWDSDGKEYLDFVAGIAVNNVGHCHPTVVEAIKRQAEVLIHTSNLYYTENQVLLAEELNRLTGMKRAFFCNSGAESVEAALKLIRRATGKSGIVAAERSFHGRTLGALDATYKAVYREPFRPLNEATFVPLQRS